MLTTIADVIREAESWEADGDTVYVRISRGPNRDRTLDHSTNHSTGEAEIGLSVTPLFWDDRHDAHDVVAALMEYTRWAPEGYDTLYLLTGDVVGTGSDDEPLLDVNNWVDIDIIDANAIWNEANGISACRTCGQEHEEQFCPVCGTESA